MNCMKKSLVFVLLLVLCGCGRSTPLAPDDILSIRILPEDPRLYLEQSVQLVIEGHRADGSVLDLTDEPGLVFRLNRKGIVNVLAGAKVQALQAGSVRLLAAFAGREDSVEVTVLYALLEDIQVTPGRLQLDAGDYVQLAVTGDLSDGSTLDLTDSLTGTVYATADQAVATVTTEGLVFAIKNGQTEITAIHGQHQATAAVSVGELEHIEVLPVQASLELQETVQLQVFGTYRDGAVQDLTGHPDTSFRSSDPTVASVDPKGLVTGVGSGDAAVTASHRDRSAVAYINVSGTSELIGVEVTPCPARLPLGGWIQLSVWADYRDGSRLEVTPGAAFSVSSELVATVDASGLVTAVGAGVAMAAAAYGGFEDTCRIQVEDRILVSIDLLPDSAALAVGETLQLMVLGVFNDGSQDDLTGSFRGTAYGSSAPAVVMVSPDGVLTALSAGEAEITAASSGLTDSSPVEVTGPELISIEVEPDRLQLCAGETASLAVWANYSDGSRRDVTGDATYLPPENGVVSVSPGGLVTALMEGDAPVLVSYLGQFDTCQVTVTSNLAAVQVDPSSVLLDPGDTQQLRVTAYFLDGGTADVTAESAYATTDGAVASADASGLVTARGPGSATITAEYGGRSDTCRVYVQDIPTPILVEVFPANVTMNVGDTVNLFVRATYSDGSTENVTRLAGYDSSAPLVASVDANGSVTAHGGGTATITASFGGLSDTCQVNVQQQNPHPTLSAVTPEQVLAGSGDTAVTLDGTGFSTVSVALLDSMHLETGFVGATRLTAVVPAAEIADVGAHEVSVYNPPPGGGLSNTRRFFAVEAPAVTTLSPDSGLQGTVVRVVFYGSGLLGCSVSAQNPGIGVSSVSYSDDGTQLSATFAIGPAAPPGTGEVSLTNLAGNTSVDFTVIEDQPLEDLVIGPGEVVFLSGVQSYRNIVIGTGAAVYGTGKVPLQFLAAGDVTVRGRIHVCGQAGRDGYTTPAEGGAAGPGGGGGGGGADGDAPAGAPGGAGSPSGQSAEAGQGAGTMSGAGGGTGAGSGIAGGCGQAGGGGGFGGGGGSGGGDAGAGAGGQGGPANPGGSDCNGGTGGGGGSCCGQNSGGGGGGGGGVLVISAVSGGDITIDGALYADGGGGGDGFMATGGGGGGSGGRITVTTEGGTIVVNDTISVRGGPGGRSDGQDAGGGGGGGRVIVDAGSGSVDDAYGYYDIRGGPAGVPREAGTGFQGLPGSPGIVDVRP